MAARDLIQRWRSKLALRTCPDCGGVLAPNWPAMAQLEAERDEARRQLQEAIAALERLGHA